MRILRQFGVLVLMLATGLSPAMACMVPGAQMTPEERACCRMMQNQCGQMEMPASHGCCQKAPTNLYDTALNASAAVLHVPAASVIGLDASALFTPEASIAGWTEHRDYSPPQSPPSTVAILRI
ncbi:MAG TPA: hypothetical protein VGI45_32195 [Terracidiphilus sp.]